MLQDAETVRDITRTAYAKWVPLIGREPLPMAADPVTAIRNHIVDILETGAGAVALIELVPEPDHLLIESVAVRPECQSQGYGGRLMAHAEEVAARRDLRRIRLYTNSVFSENIAYYRHLGFAETHRSVMVPGSETVHMAKDL
ncbi:MAG: GNAT family N-acetyltransferase [Pseudomonadota bacterium]